MLSAISITALVIFFYMFIIFLIAQLIKNNSIVDIGWGLGFILITITNLIITDAISTRQIIVSVLTIIWGIRLSTYLFFRNKGKPEDFRYTQMRKNWGDKARIKAFIWVFMLQGSLMIMIGFPIVWVNQFGSTSINVIDIFGIFIWIIGFFFQAVSDFQLSRFIKFEKKYSGQIMKKGLWKCSRHPNYFGETVMWWGIYILVCSSQYGWATIFSPILITFLLLKVSGVPLLEKKYSENNEFLEYAKGTNKFFPWFP